MSSLPNHRSSSTRSSRRTQTERQTTSSRSSSVPHREFLIILTNDAYILQQTRRLQGQIQQRIQPTMAVQNNSTSPPVTNPNSNNNNNNNNNNANNNNREQILRTLLRVELQEVTRDYLSRTRRSYPINYVFDMSDIETSQHR